MKIIFIILLTLSFNLHAKTIARVIDVKGNSFSFVNGKNAKTLGYGSQLSDLSEVMVEDGATLSVLLTAGEIVHINGGSLVKFFQGNLELKNGHLWVISSNNSLGSVSTSNSIAQYDSGQFIYSYDNISGKTQLLVLSGNVKLSNALEPNVAVDVAAGQFSLIDNSYESGLPRGATKVGLQSYKLIKSLFSNFDSLQKSKIGEMIISESPKKKMAKREIASVNDQFSSSNSSTSPSRSMKKGRVISLKTVTSSRSPASTGAMDYYKEIKKEEDKLKRPQKTGTDAPIRYFGFKPSPVVPETVSQKSMMSRIPASVPQAVAPVRVPASIDAKSLINDLKKTDFENSFDVESKKIKRHSNEVNHLIDELGTYKKDFNKNY